MSTAWASGDHVLRTKQNKNPETRIRKLGCKQGRILACKSAWFCLFSMLHPPLSLCSSPPWPGTRCNLPSRSEASPGVAPFSHNNPTAGGAGTHWKARGGGGSGSHTCPQVWVTEQVSVCFESARRRELSKVSGLRLGNEQDFCFKQLVPILPLTVRVTCCLLAVTP